jgi:hypothetical protein
MNFGDTWPHGPQPGAPAVTLPPRRDRTQRLLAWEVFKLEQRDAQALADAEPADDAA